MTFRAKGPFPLIKAYFHSRKISTDRKFSENDKMSLLKVENFQLQNFFPTENLCRPITFYKIFCPVYMEASYPARRVTRPSGTNKRSVYMESCYSTYSAFAA
jgi:hypothetical protein